MPDGSSVSREPYFTLCTPILVASKRVTIMYVELTAGCTDGKLSEEPALDVAPQVKHGSAMYSVQ